MPFVALDEEWLTGLDDEDLGVVREQFEKDHGGSLRMRCMAFVISTEAAGKYEICVTER